MCCWMIRLLTYLLTYLLTCSVKSYENMESTGLVKIIGVNDLSDLKGRNVLIVEVGVVLYCIVLYCIVCIVLYCIVLYCIHELTRLVGYD